MLRRRSRWGRSVLLVGLASLASSVGGARAAGASPPPTKFKVAVTDFTVRDPQAIRNQDVFSTQVLTEKLKTALVQTRKFDVLEREQLDSVMKELEFGKSSVADKKQAPRAGKLAAADYLIKGEISVFEAKGTAVQIPSTSYYRLAQIGDIICDLRVIDVETGKVATAAHIETIHRTEIRGQSSQAPPVDAVFYDDLQRKFVTQVANKIIETIYPIKIASIEGNVVYLNRGEGSDLQPGDVLAAYRLGEPIRDPDTKEVLGQKETLVGEVVVDEVLPKLSKATWRSDGEKPEAGMVVRRELR